LRNATYRADFQAWRDHQTAEKYRRLDRGEPMPPNWRSHGSASGWLTPFDAPIVLAKGKQLVTLRDAIQHFGKTTPKRERNHPSVVLAATILTNAAEGRDLVMHARIATLRGVK
jgi:hypothetical protein